MAIRSGAGTGVVVSLVVFVLTTIFLLVLTIVFYAGQQKEKETSAAAKRDLEKYVEPREANTDLFKRFEAGASERGQSVAKYLHEELASTMQFAAGNPDLTPEALRSNYGRLGVSDDENVLSAYRRATTDLKLRQNELDSAKDQLAEMERELESRQNEMDQLRAANEEEVQGLISEIDSYRVIGDEYKSKVDETVDQLRQAEARTKSRFEARIDELEAENDQLGQNLVLMRQRIDEYEEIFDAIRITGKDPAQLVDADVIDVIGRNDQVFIDRGKRDRIVLGMTFEVYPDAGSIRVDQRTGELPRGKASLQVIKVGETTSTCKITRSVLGRPVVRGDVVANAVYDPQYSFKFLVHGKFDVDGDGRPSEAEAEYIRSLISDWGGSVVYANDLPGDLDFLVLGAEPPVPPLLREAATDIEIETYMQRRQAQEQYNRLYKEATEAQIPVLNANRFFILIGHTER